MYARCVYSVFNFYKDSHNKSFCKRFDTLRWLSFTTMNHSCSFLQDDIRFSVSSSKTSYFPLFGRFRRTKYAEKTSLYSIIQTTQATISCSFNHTKLKLYKCMQYLIIRRRSKHIHWSKIMYLPPKPLIRCNVNAWSSNNLKIKREIKFNLFLKSSLIRYVIFPLYFVFMNEKRFPLKISHKFYFKFTVSTEIFSQQK